MRVPPARVVVPRDDRLWIHDEIDKALDSGRLTLGEHTRQLEEEFAARHEVRWAVAVNSGTSSLEIPLRCFDVAGREVIVPTNTFFATAAAVVHAGGVLRLADIDADTFSLSLDTITAVATPRTAGVVLVHIGGMLTPQAQDIRRLCDERGWFLLEDAAHAHGASLRGKPAGGFGHAGSFSFYPTKVITSGEGGMITSNDDRLRDEALVYRDQGKAGFATNFHTRMGYNWRMSELSAIVGRSQLRRMDEFVARRRAIAATYDEGISAIEGVSAVRPPDGVESCYYKYLAMLDPGVDRAELKSLLRDEFGVGLSGEVYDTPLHCQPIFEKYAAGAFPVAEDVCARHVCLSIASDMTDAEAEYVLQSLAKATEQLMR